MKEKNDVENLNLMGRLCFIGWDKGTWLITPDTPDIKINLKEKIEHFFSTVDGKPADHEFTSTMYLFETKSEGYEWVCWYKPGDYIVLVKRSEFGFSNVVAYLERILLWSNGRVVNVEIKFGEKLKIAPIDTVNLVKLKEGVGEIDIDTARNICKLGKGPEACIFLAIDENEFSCTKFDITTAPLILHRFSQGLTEAKRIGNCGLWKQ